MKKYLIVSMVLALGLFACGKGNVNGNKEADKKEDIKIESTDLSESKEDNKTEAKEDDKNLSSDNKDEVKEEAPKEDATIGEAPKEEAPKEEASVTEVKKEEGTIGEAPSELKNETTRGTLKSISNDDKEITFDTETHGEVIVLVSDKTEIEGELKEGSEYEIVHTPMMTRSLPPQIPQVSLIKEIK